MNSNSNPIDGIAARNIAYYEGLTEKAKKNVSQEIKAGVKKAQTVAKETLISGADTPTANVQANISSSEFSTVKPQEQINLPEPLKDEKKPPKNTNKVQKSGIFESAEKLKRSAKGVTDSYNSGIKLEEKMPVEEKRMGIREEFRKNFLEEKNPAERQKLLVELSLNVTELNLLEQINGLYTDKAVTNEQKREILKFVDDAFENGIISKETLTSHHYLFFGMKEESSALKSFIENFREKVAHSKKTYTESLKNFIWFGKKANRTEQQQIHRFLLKPYEKEFRKDFLLDGPWMSFGKESSALIDEMEKIFNEEGCSIEQKEVILKFASKAIEQGVLKDKDKATNLMHHVTADNAPGLQRIIQKAKENPELKDLAERLEKAKPMLRHDIDYKIDESANRTSLAICLESLAQGKILELKRDRNFIKDFASDLATLSSNQFKNVQPSELHGQAWTKTNFAEIGPNLKIAIDSFNQKSSFIADTVLSGNDLKECYLLYAAFIEVAKQLVDVHHDYNSAQMINSALNNSSLTRLFTDEAWEKKPRAVQKGEEFLSNLFSTEKNFKNLRDAYQKCEAEGIAYTPVQVLVLSDLTFMDDGNPDTIDGKTNFEKMEMLKNKHTEFKNAQEALPEETFLHYDLPHQMQPTYDDEGQKFARSLQLKPRKPKP